MQNGLLICRRAYNGQMSMFQSFLPLGSAIVLKDLMSWQRLRRQWLSIHINGSTHTRIMRQGPTLDPLSHVAIAVITMAALVMATRLSRFMEHIDSFARINAFVYNGAVSWVTEINQMALPYIRHCLRLTRHKQRRVTNIQIATVREYPFFNAFILSHLLKCAKTHQLR